MDGISWHGRGIRPDRAGDRSVGLRCHQKDRHAKRLSQKNRLSGTCQDGGKTRAEIAGQTYTQARRETGRQTGHEFRAQGDLWHQRLKPCKRGP